MNFEWNKPFWHVTDYVTMSSARFEQIGKKWQASITILDKTFKSEILPRRNQALWSLHRKVGFDKQVATWIVEQQGYYIDENGYTQPSNKPS